MSAQLQVHSDPPGIQVRTHVKTRIHIPVDSEVIWGGSEDIWAAEVNLLFKDLPELQLPELRFSCDGYG